ncbi:hypothetical protein K466DRAFT_464337, partial [Polyporus arcularius HHB13444]
DDHAEGVETVERDEYEDYFGDDTELMNLDVPEESALNACEAAHSEAFQKKIEALTLQSCSVCHEQGFDLNVRDSQCSRCRTDKGDPVKKFSPENNAVPDPTRPACLQNLTEMEEMLISRILPMMQVRYTRG